VSDSVKVVLVRNPWPQTVPDNVLLQFLMTAASSAKQEINCLIQEGKLAEEHDSFAAVLIDPTDRVTYDTISDAVMAIILIGPNAEKFIPNAAAKADAHKRHDLSNGEIVHKANFCLTDGEFAWGYSAEYMGAVGAGSGLKDTQDRDVTFLILKTVLERVHRARADYIRNKRIEHGSWAWYNTTNTPDSDYAVVTELLSSPGALIAPAAE
jgi:hypothetical protein